MSKIRNRLRLEILGSVALLLIGAAACTPEPLNNTARPSEGTAPVTPIPLSATSEVTVQPAVSPTQNPIATPDATEIDATLRADYAAYATERAKVGASVVPYETEAYYRTAAVVDMTRQADLLLTPTPFGPLPFPGIRLTDEELAERGWSRIESDGRRNTDYHATAIWLDKAYVDAEIFSQYQALFELLAFRDGPPGDDFEARLRELMLPSSNAQTISEADVEALKFGKNLASCSYEAILANITRLRAAGAYVRMRTDKWYTTDELFWRAFRYEFPLTREGEAFVPDRMNAWQISSHFVAESQIKYPDPFSPQFPVVEFSLTAVETGREMIVWQEDFSPELDGAHAVFVWEPVAKKWYVYRLGSIYCDDFFQTAVRR